MCMDHRCDFYALKYIVIMILAGHMQLVTVKNMCNYTVHKIPVRAFRFVASVLGLGTSYCKSGSP